MLLVGAIVIGAPAVGCGSSQDPSGFDNPHGTSAEAGTGGFGTGNEEAAAACQGLRCQQEACGGGGDTTVTGTVFAPNGKHPIYNAIVYVPNAEPAPLVKGATCDKCGAVTGDPVTSTITEPNGNFILKNVPIGKNIPLVVQVGKWRRKVTIPEVKSCTENKLLDPELTRLPKNQSEGDMPRIALTSGGCDTLGCMLPKVGIDASEFGVASDGPTKSVHTYLGAGLEADLAGGPNGAPPASTLWNDVNQLKNYDMVILSCECREARDGEDSPTKNATSFAAMNEYLNAGGRIFTTDFMYTWYKYSPDPQMQSIASIPGGAPPVEGPMTLDATFPKGKALYDWFNVVVPGSNGQISPDIVFGNYESTVASKTQVWASSPKGFSGTGTGPRVMTTNVPVGVDADKQCGKGVHIDAHVNQPGLGGDRVDTSFPNSCPDPIKPAENLLAFFFFDLASCIQNEQAAPTPPPIVK
ncbi:Tryptophan synthase alpha chain [Labilithrix luteola]|uniref:Tryptophan synthase alpha chain n=1 Tax=Labilithrix luteola TaxID=1391654 RepID=A0A0K1Q5Q5_9BACT|nr:Tryptophan synthase alpha chain [Labilithrix luteola]